MLSREQILALQAGASAPQPITGRAKWMNGQFVLDDPVTQPKKKKKGFFLDNVSTGGSLAGALAGGAAGTAILPGVGTVIGGILGGVLGGGGGQVAENAIAGDKLGTDVASEALWGGATALPIGSVAKLGKAGGVLVKGLGKDAARVAAKDLVVEAGVKAMPKKAIEKLSLSDALKVAPAQAAAEKLALAPTVGQKVAEKLTGAADDLAVKQFRLKPSQTTNFKAKFGEDAGEVIRKYGFHTADDIAEKGIEPLQEQFGSIVKNVGEVSTDTVKKNFDTAISKLKGASSSTNRSIGEQLQSEVDGILKKYGKTINSDELNGIRREFDSLVNYTNKVADPNKYGVNKRVADVLRRTLQDSDPSGELKSVGRELSKLRQLSEDALKQEGLGRGNLPLSIPSLIGAGLGSGAGGIPGMIAGGVATATINSPAGRRAVSSAVDKAAGKLAAGGTKADIGQALKQAAIRIGGTGAARTVLDSAQSSDPSTMDTTPIMSNAETMPSAANMSQSYPEAPQMSNPLGYSSVDIGQALMKAYAAGDTAAAKQLEGMYQLSSDWEQSQAKATTTKPMSAEAAKQLANAQTALEALDTIESTINSDPGAQKKSIIPGSAGGGLAGALLGTGQYEAARQQAIDVIGRLRSGGAIQADEEKRFKAFLPQPYDNAETTRYKLGQLRNAFMTLAAGVAGNSSQDIATPTAGY